jgi:hypothetical protein
VILFFGLGFLVQHLTQYDKSVAAGALAGVVIALAIPDREKT